MKFWHFRILSFKWCLRSHETREKKNANTCINALKLKGFSKEKNWWYTLLTWSLQINISNTGIQKITTKIHQDWIIVSHVWQKVVSPSVQEKISLMIHRCNYLQFGTEMNFHLLISKIELSSSRDDLCQVWSTFIQWFWRRWKWERKKWENMNFQFRHVKRESVRYHVISAYSTRVYA